MTEEEKDIRIKELETFLQEDILDDVYYYHSPIWYRATELLNQNKDKEDYNIIAPYNKVWDFRKWMENPNMNDNNVSENPYPVMYVEDKPVDWRSIEFPRVKNLTGTIAHKLPSVKPK